MDQIVSIISDILLGAGALGAAVYCGVLAQRLKRFNNLENGVGGAVALLWAQVDDIADRVAKGDLHAPLAIGPATEVDVGQPLAGHRAADGAFGRHRRLRLGRRRHRAGTTAGADTDEHAVTFGSDFVWHLLEQVDDDAGPVTGLDRGDTARHADRDRRDLLREAAGRAGEVDCDTRRIVGRERTGRRQRLAGGKHDLHPVARHRRETDVLQLVGQRIGHQGPKQHRSHQCNVARPYLGKHHAFSYSSPSASATSFSRKPLPVGTSSISSIFSSLMRVILPSFWPM